MQLKKEPLSPIKVYSPFFDTSSVLSISKHSLDPVSPHRFLSVSPHQRANFYFPLSWNFPL